MMGGWAPDLQQAEGPINGCRLAPSALLTTYGPRRAERSTN